MANCIILGIYLAGAFAGFAITSSIRDYADAYRQTRAKLSEISRGF